MSAEAIHCDGFHRQPVQFEVISNDDGVDQSAVCQRWTNDWTMLLTERIPALMFVTSVSSLMFYCIYMIARGLIILTWIMNYLNTRDDHYVHPIVVQRNWIWVSLFLLCMHWQFHFLNSVKDMLQKNLKNASHYLWHHPLGFKGTHWSLI